MLLWRIFAETTIVIIQLVQRRHAEIVVYYTIQGDYYYYMRLPTILNKNTSMTCDLKSRKCNV